MAFCILRKSILDNICSSFLPFNSLRIFCIPLLDVSIFLVLIFAIGSVTFSVIGPKILGKATTEIFNGLVSKVSGEGTGIDFDAIKRILMTLLHLMTFLQEN